MDMANYVKKPISLICITFLVLEGKKQILTENIFL